jgi:hypothetical protein
MNLRIVSRMNKSDSKFFIICIIKSEHKKNRIKNFTLYCDCELKPTSNKWSQAVSHLVGEIHDTQRQVLAHRYLHIARLTKLIQLLFKNPALVYSLLFNFLTFEFMPKSNCQSHRLLVYGVQDIWYSRSSATLGFPWSREVFLNSLDAVRNSNFEILVFAINPELIDNRKEKSEVVENKIRSGNYLKISSATKQQKHTEKLGSWQSTDFYLYKEASILHGLLLTQNGLYIETDLSIDRRLSNYTFGPSGLWTEINSFNDDSVLTMKIVNDSYLEKVVLFIQTNSNFYHFLIDSLRPLYFVLEKNIFFEAIAVRDDLPQRYFEIITWLAPGATIIRLAKGQQLRARAILASTIVTKLSTDPMMFTSSGSKFLEDEWRSFGYLRAKQISSKVSEEILFMPRERYESRGIINNTDLEKMLLSEGAATISPKLMNFSTQLEYYSRSKIFISAGGASLTNAIFLPKGSILIELTYPWGHNWRLISVFCNLQYISFPLQSMLPGRLRTIADTYKVNVNKLEKLIAELKHT